MSELPPSDRDQTASNSGVWIAGLILIALGVLFLLQNLTSFSLGHNWWALFILLATVGAWSSAWRVYQNNGHQFTRAVTAPLIGGLFPLAIAAIFLFDLSWGTMWPIFLILAGIAALFGSLQRS